MSASMHRRGCLQLGICQDRPTCTECTRLHSSEGHQSALRIERLINSRHQHTVYEPMPQRKARKPKREWPWHVAAPALVCLSLLAVHFLAR